MSADDVSATRQGVFKFSRPAGPYSAASTLKNASRAWRSALVGQSGRLLDHTGRLGGLDPGGGRGEESKLCWKVSSITACGSPRHPDKQQQAGSEAARERRVGRAV